MELEKKPLDKAASERRERLAHIVTDGKISAADKRDIRELLREPGMQEKIRVTAELLFGRTQYSGLTEVDLQKGKVSNEE